jgi:hypothetical protein
VLVSHTTRTFVSRAEEDIKAKVGDALFTIGKNGCMKNKWLSFDKVAKLYRRTDVGAVDSLAITLRDVQTSGGSSISEATLKDLKRRQLVEIG